MVGKRTSSATGGFADMTTPSVMLELEKYDGMVEDSVDENDMTTSEEPLLRKSWFELQRVSLLGKGVYSNVHMVVDPQTKRQYALKCLDANRIATPDNFLDAACDLARETALLATLNHDNIIQLCGLSSQSISESYQNDDGFFILMDVLQETLKDRMDRWRSDKSLFQKTAWNPKRFLFFGRKTKLGNLDWNRMLGRIETVALGTVRGMRYLHEEQQICIRDLKPANIGFDATTGQVRLFDFGLSRSMDECQSDKEVIGTPRYMAPEVMINQGTSFASDVYSFGVVLYELCSLKTAFSKEQSLEDFQKHVVNAQARPKLNCIPDGSLRALIADCWSQGPNQRPNFAEVHGRLLDILSSSSLMEELQSSSSRLFRTKSSALESTHKTYRLDHGDSSLQFPDPIAAHSSGRESAAGSSKTSECSFATNNALSLSAY